MLACGGDETAPTAREAKAEGLLLSFIGKLQGLAVRIPSGLRTHGFQRQIDPQAMIRHRAR